MNEITDLSWIKSEPEAEYHAMSKSGKAMSSHLLADFINSPLLYYKKTMGMIEESRSSTLIIGSAVHKLILEGRDAFDACYVVSDGPVNEKTGEHFGKSTKIYKAWLETQDSREVLSTEDFGLVAHCFQGVESNANASCLLSVGRPEGVARAMVNGVLCQIRMDWFNPQMGLVDLKTCQELRTFEGDARRFGYVRQMAFYRLVIRILTGENVDVFIVAVEKNEPYSCGVWMVSSAVLDAFESQVLAALERYKACVDSTVWPSGYETTRVLE